MPYYRMALRRTTVPQLIRVNQTVKVTVRQWLALLADTTTAYSQALVKEGSLGIPLVR